MPVSSRSRRSRRSEALALVRSHRHGRSAAARLHRVSGKTGERSTSQGDVPTSKASVPTLGSSSNFGMVGLGESRRSVRPAKKPRCYGFDRSNGFHRSISDADASIPNEPGRILLNDLGMLLALEGLPRELGVLLLKTSFGSLRMERCRPTNDRWNSLNRSNPWQELGRWCQVGSVTWQIVRRTRQLLTRPRQNGRWRWHFLRRREQNLWRRGLHATAPRQYPTRPELPPTRPALPPTRP